MTEVINMSFEAAKCPNCGASIQVPTDTESAKCMYCGQSLIVKEAIRQHKIEVSGQIKVEGVSSVQNDITRGKQCLAAKDWESAHASFSLAISKDATNYDAWYGRLVAQTQNFLDVCYWVSFSGAEGIDSTIRNCMKYATAEQKQEIRYKLSNMTESMKADEEEDFRIRREKYNRHLEQMRRQNSRKTTVFIIGSVLIAVVLIIGFVVEVIPGVLAILLGIVSGIVMLVAALWTKTTIEVQEQKHDQRVLNLINGIRKALNS